MNNFTGIGRLTRDPELVYAKSGTEITKFTIAINRRFNREETDFIDCVCFKKLAENCVNFLHKGSMCAVSGELQISSYEGQDGQKRKQTQIVANEVEFLSPKGDNKPQEKPQGGQDKAWAELGDISIDGDPDSIPF